MTNLDRIKNMTLDELAAMLSDGTAACKICVYYKSSLCYVMDCKNYIKAWLEQEAEE